MEGTQPRHGEGRVPGSAAVLTGLGAAARVRAAGTTDVTAAAVRTTLAPADPQQHEEERNSQDHQADKHPLWEDTDRAMPEAAHWRGGHALIGAPTGEEGRGPGGAGALHLTGCKARRLWGLMEPAERRGPPQGWGMAEGGSPRSAEHAG